MATKKQLTQQDVNKIAKYVYNHIDGAYKITFGANFVDIYMNVYYHDRVDEDPVKTMRLDINMTSYSSKIRYNVTEMTAMENTFLHGTIEITETTSMEDVKNAIYNRIVNSIRQEFEDYDFIF